jgi:hypothetical protein
MQIKASAFNFWNYDTSLTVDFERDRVSGLLDETNRMPIANLCMSLGTSIDDLVSFTNAKLTVPGAGSDKLVAAHMVVYASFVVAACAADKLNRGKDKFGLTLTYTYDLYAAAIWTCRALRRALDSLPGGDPTWTFVDVIQVLSRALAKETAFNKPEVDLNAWETVDVMAGNLGAFVAIGDAYMGNNAIKLPGEVGKVGCRFTFSTTTQAAIAESLFNKYMHLSIATRPVSDYLTRVAYVPLFMAQALSEPTTAQNLRALWMSDKKDRSTIAALVELEATCRPRLCTYSPPDPKAICEQRARDGEPVFWDPTTNECLPTIPITPLTPEEECQKRQDGGEDVFWDPLTKKCLPRIPVTPALTPEEECKKRQDAGEDVFWDPVSKSCLKRIPITPVLTPEEECKKRKDAGEDVFWDGSNCIKRVKPIPSGGGGGGGGGGGSGPALFIGILALLALFGRR